MVARSHQGTPTSRHAIRQEPPDYLLLRPPPGGGRNFGTAKLTITITRSRASPRAPRSRCRPCAVHSIGHSLLAAASTTTRARASLASRCAIVAFLCTPSPTRCRSAHRHQGQQVGVECGWGSWSSASTPSLRPPSFAPIEREPNVEEQPSARFALSFGACAAWGVNASPPSCAASTSAFLSGTQSCFWSSLFQQTVHGHNGGKVAFVGTPSCFGRRATTRCCYRPISQVRR
jgi:hypothetical protein